MVLSARCYTAALQKSTDCVQVGKLNWLPRVPSAHSSQQQYLHAEANSNIPCRQSLVQQAERQ